MMLSREEIQKKVTYHLCTHHLRGEDFNKATVEKLIHREISDNEWKEYLQVSIYTIYSSRILHRMYDLSKLPSSYSKNIFTGNSYDRSEKRFIDIDLTPEDKSLYGRFGDEGFEYRFTTDLCDLLDIDRNKFLNSRVGKGFVEEGLSKLRYTFCKYTDEGVYYDEQSYLQLLYIFRDECLKWEFMHRFRKDVIRMTSEKESEINEYIQSEISRLS